MATQPQTGLTYEDLATFPEDNLRRELIDGELIVTAAPGTRHQGVVAILTHALFVHAEQHGGRVFPAPTDVYLTHNTVVEPDVVFVTAEHTGQIEDPFVRGAPDLVVEVASPTTRRLEIVRKRELYERYGVPEYWYVDLDADRVEIHRLGADGRYPKPQFLGPADGVTSPLLPGFELPIADLLAGD